MNFWVIIHHHIIQQGAASDQICFVLPLISYMYIQNIIIYLDKTLDLNIEQCENINFAQMSTCSTYENKTKYNVIY